MPGPKDKKNLSDAMSSFFGDDDEWMEDDDSEVVEGEAAPPAPAEPAPASVPDEPAPTVVADEPAPPPVEPAAWEPAPADPPPPAPVEDEPLQPAEPEAPGVAVAPEEQADAPAEPALNAPPVDPEPEEPALPPIPAPPKLDAVPVAPPPPPRFSLPSLPRVLPPPVAETAAPVSDEAAAGSAESAPVADAPAPVEPAEPTRGALAGAGAPSREDVPAAIAAEAASGDPSAYTTAVTWGLLLGVDPAVVVGWARSAPGDAGRAALAQALQAAGDPEAPAAWAAYGEQAGGPDGAAALRTAAALDPARALAWSRAAAEANPDDAGAWSDLREAALRAGDVASADAAGERLAALIDPVPGASVLVDVARRRRDLGDVDGALAAYRAARAMDPDAPATLRELEATAAAAGDAFALGQTYATQAAGADGAAAWWWVHAARAQRTVGDADAAAASYAQAQGSLVACWEGAGWALSAGRIHDLAELAAAAAAAGGSASAVFAAVVAELGLRDPAAAVLAWRPIAEGGSEVGVAGLARALRAAGRDAELLELLAGRPDGGTAADRLLRAELLERGDPRSPEALALYAALTEDGAGGRRELEGLLRVARRHDDAALLVRALDRLAEIIPSAERRGQLLMEQVMILRYRLADPARAAAVLQRLGTTPPSSTREMQVGMQIEAGQLESAAELLASGGAEEGGLAGADQLFRAALLRWVSPGDQASRVVELLEAALGLDPENANAAALLADAAGAARADMIGRAAVGPDAPALRASIALVQGQPVDADAPTALAAIDAAARQDLAAWGAALAGVEAPDAALYRCEALAAVDRDAALAALGAVETSGAAVGALLALQLGDVDAAARLAAASGDARLRLWVAEEGAGPDEALLADVEARDPLVAALARRRWLTADADVAEAELAIARACARPAAVAEHARRAALAFAAQERHAEAFEAWSLVAEAVGPRAEAARARFAAAVRSADPALIDRLEGDGVVDAERVRAHATWLAGLPAAEALGVLPGPNTAEGAALEVALSEEERWPEVFRALTLRLSTVAHPWEQHRIERCRRWVLAEKLADTDEAWASYQQLHAEHPEDRDVLENLARIAGARGDRDRAIGYLTELAESAPTPADAARCHRRIAEVWLVAEDDAYASQALYNALDAVPDDVEALAGLRAIATRREDYPSLLSLLRREASIREGDERVALLREVAELTERHIDERAAAVDAWRALADANPADMAAWGRLLDLAESAGEDDTFLEIASSVETKLEGAERSALHRRMGLVCERNGRRDDAIHFFEQAVAAEEPDLIAARRLEEVYREAVDWTGVVRALAVLGRHAGSAEQRLQAWLDAAAVERDKRHDREGAARAFEEVLLVDPDNLAALRYLATWTFDAGRHAEAEPLFERLAPRLDAAIAGEGLAEEDASVEAAAFWFRFAEAARLRGDDGEAITRYQRALVSDDVLLPALDAVGPLLTAAERWSEAVVVWRRLLRITGGVGDPGRAADVLTRLGEAERALGQNESAFTRFQRALEAFPNYVPALRGLARELEARADWNALLSVYNAVIYHATLPADVIEAYMTKGRVLDEQLHRPDKAIQHFERSLAFEARQPVASLRLAELALRRELYDDALGYAARGLEACEGPSDVAAELHLARALALAGLDEANGATDALATARAMSPTVDAAMGPSPLSHLGAAAAALRARLPR